MTATFSDLLLRRVYADELAVDPIAWCRDRLDEELWSKQLEIFNAVSVHRKTAVKSAHGLGKSHTASRVMAHWLDTHPTGSAFVVSTAPTFDQVRAILWRYIGQAHRKGKLRGRVNQTEWHIGDEIVGYGRKPADYDESGFQGIHAPHVLVVIDEAGGIPAQLWVAVQTLVTNERCRILAIGNPDDPDSEFASCFKPDSDWHQITITAFDSPNYTGEPVSPELAAELTGPVWVEEVTRSWGVESPLYVSKVLAQFPEDATDGVVPGSAIARRRIAPDPIAPDPIPPDDAADVQLGVDVGAGGDQSVIRERRGMRAGRVWRSRHDDSMRLSGEIVQAILDTGASRVCIDVIGWGWGVKGRVEEVCQERGIPCAVVGVNVAHAAHDKRRFKNRRSELWWDARERSLETRGTWDLSAIDDDTAADLTAPRYSLDSRGYIIVEPKAETKRRIGRSPDDADALLLAFDTTSQAVRLHKPKDLRRPIRSGKPGRATLGSR